MARKKTIYNALPKRNLHPEPKKEPEGKDPEESHVTFVKPQTPGE